MGAGNQQSRVSPAREDANVHACDGMLGSVCISAWSGSHRHLRANLAFLLAAHPASSTSLSLVPAPSPSALSASCPLSALPSLAMWSHALRAPASSLRRARLTTLSPAWRRTLEDAHKRCHAVNRLATLTSDARPRNRATTLISPEARRQHRNDFKSILRARGVARSCQLLIACVCCHAGTCWVPRG